LAALHLGESQKAFCKVLSRKRAKTVICLQFGRLIRTATDRGVVAVFDRRLHTKTYGQTFLKSLPECAVRRGPRAELERAVAEWMNQPRQT